MDWHIIGLGVSALSMFGRYRLPAIRKPIASAGITVGLGIIALGIIPPVRLCLSATGIICLALLVGVIDWKIEGWLRPQGTPSHNPTSKHIAEQRSAILRQLTDLYMLSHDGISPQMLAGIELPPADFLNHELARQKATWRVTSVNGPNAEIYELS